MASPAIDPLISQPASVSTLLRQSRLHADTRKRLANSKTPDYAAAETAAALALDLRLQAEAADPLFADSAWALDRAPHAAIATFLRGYSTPATPRD